MDWILSIFFLLPYLSKPNITCLKSLCKDLIATTIDILFYMSLFRITATFNYLTRNLTLAKILVIGFSNSLGLLILGYIKSFWRIEYTTPGSTCEHTTLNFSHMTFGSFLSLILFNRLLLTSFFMILMAIPITI